MSFLQPIMLAALPIIALPIIIHLINQWRYQTKQWSAMMFLLAANRMNRGFARIRRWLILAMRTLAVAGLIFAISRPLSSGLLSLTSGGGTDTTIVLMDRSPSMLQIGNGNQSKLATGRQQLANALSTLGSEHWVAIDAATGAAETFDSVDEMVDSPAFLDSSASTDLPSMFQSCLDYIQTNKPGPTEVWICSDLRKSDWNIESGNWTAARDGFMNIPQSVRFHLLAYPDSASSNLSIRVTEAQRQALNEEGVRENNLLLSLVVTQHGEIDASESRTIPLQIEIDGTRSELSLELTGIQTELRNAKIPLASNQETGWGRVSLPADQNNADNEYYFVFAEEQPRRVVVVSDNRGATKPLEIAAGISRKGEDNANIEVIAPDQVDSLVLSDCALLLWQTDLPSKAIAPAIVRYVDEGGQVIFFPPSSLVGGQPIGESSSFLGVSWREWKSNIDVMVENWRGDQDLLAATLSGTGLPVGQIKLSGFAELDAPADILKLASLTGGSPLVAKMPTDHGGVYFFTASADPQVSSLAESGIVLFIAIQRAVEQGQMALGNTTQRFAEFTQEDTREWTRVVGADDKLSTEYPWQQGVYRNEDKLFAVNRSLQEDRQDLLADQEIEKLFAGLQFSRVDDSAGNLSGIVREVWRIFLILMILAMLLEAALCMPRKNSDRARAASPSI